MIWDVVRTQGAAKRPVDVSCAPPPRGRGGWGCGPCLAAVTIGSGARMATRAHTARSASAARRRRPCRRAARLHEHEAVGAVVHRVDDVRDLGAAGAHVGAHALHHLARGGARAPGAEGGDTQRPLSVRTHVHTCARLGGARTRERAGRATPFTPAPPHLAGDKRGLPREVGLLDEPLLCEGHLEGGSTAGGGAGDEDDAARALSMCPRHSAARRRPALNPVCSRPPPAYPVHPLPQASALPTHPTLLAGMSIARLMRDTMTPSAAARISSKAEMAAAQSTCAMILTEGPPAASSAARTCAQGCEARAEHGPRAPPRTLGPQRGVRNRLANAHAYGTVPARAVSPAPRRRRSTQRAR